MSARKAKAIMWGQFAAALLAITVLAFGLSLLAEQRNERWEASSKAREASE